VIVQPIDMIIGIDTLGVIILIGVGMIGDGTI
jgi:hypothetical protein